MTYESHCFPLWWDFFPNALGLYSHLIGKMFPTYWEYLPIILGISSQYEGDNRGLLHRKKKM